MKNTSSFFHLGGGIGQRKEFEIAVKRHSNDFNVELTVETISLLGEYFESVMEENPLLHLVAPCSPVEFATRHVLESLTLLPYLPSGAAFGDVGSGAGLPSIPCLIARADLNGLLIESKAKKAHFLERAAKRCGLEGRVEIINRQFSETAKPNVSFITCRALDRFTDNLPRLLKWANGADMLLFGGASLRDALDAMKRRFEEKLMPLSDQRYLFIVNGKSRA